MYGAQTIPHSVGLRNQFENDVEMYGAQTFYVFLIYNYMFENDVEMYGAQTGFQLFTVMVCLRMMQKCMVLKLNSSEA